MNTKELIEALDQRYGNPLAKDCELIQEAIKQLQFLLDDNEALKKQVSGK
jgi:hypothetical protein